jgi:F0F1-type ATP synthase epsilon subunit
MTLRKAGSPLVASEKLFQRRLTRAEVATAVVAEGFCHCQAEVLGVMAEAEIAVLQIRRRRDKRATETAATASETTLKQELRAC